MVSEVRDGFSFMCFVVFFRIKTNALLSYHLLPVHPTLSIQYYHFVFLVTCQNEYIHLDHTTGFKIFKKINPFLILISCHDKPLTLGSLIVMKVVTKF